MSIPRYYTGTGAGTARTADLPRLRLDDLSNPDDYLAAPDLAAAVDVALTLGMPLLLTGEPGCGKSAFADSVADAERLLRDWAKDPNRPGAG